MYRDVGEVDNFGTVRGFRIRIRAAVEGGRRVVYGWPRSLAYVSAEGLRSCRWPGTCGRLLRLVTEQGTGLHGALIWVAPYVDGGWPRTARASAGMVRASVVVAAAEDAPDVSWGALGQVAVASHAIQELIIFALSTGHLVVERLQ